MNVVNLTLTVALVSGAYVAWMYIPLWLDDLDVREALAAGVGQLTNENAGRDGPAVQAMVSGRLASVGTHWEVQNGAPVEVPGLGIDPDDVQVERSKDGRSGKLTVDYVRTVRLKPTNQYWTVRFHTSREAHVRP